MTTFVEKYRRMSTAQCPLWLRQAARFVAVGVLNTALDVGLYLALTRAIAPLAAWPIAAKAISYCAGILNSFYWNRSWTFQSDASASKVFVPFVLISLLALAVNAGVMSLGLGVLNLPEALALMMATAISMGWNFVLNKLVVF